MLMNNQWVYVELIELSPNPTGVHRQCLMKVYLSYSIQDSLAIFTDWMKIVCLNPTQIVSIMGSSTWWWRCRSPSFRGDRWPKSFNLFGSQSCFFLTAWVAMHYWAYWRGEEKIDYARRLHHFLWFLMVVEV
jgi:hypothetical protein